MKRLLREWRIQLLIVALLAAIGIIFANGLSYGIDFKGGTSFQVQLAKPPSSGEEMAHIVSVLSQRLDWTGLKDTTVTSVGRDVVLIDIAETDPENVAKIETLIQKQGKFEAILDGNVIFDGSDIIQIVKDPARGYGYLQADKLFEWHLPFILKGTAAKRFTEMAFHRCRLTSFSQEESGKKYDCDKTYFFLDRPADSLLVVPSETLARDEILLQNGNRAEDIPAEMTSEEVFLNANIPYLAIDSNADANSSAASLEKLKELKATSSYAIVPKDIAAKTRQELLGIGYKIKEVETKSDIPYIWQATGLKSVIYLSEDVTNLDPYVADVKDAKIFSELLIRGSGSDEKEASDRLKSLTILLESGSLPIPVESISKETISPWLGKEFLRQAAMMGLAALFVVAIVIFIRYRQLKLVLPIMSTALFEALLVLGFAALIHWNLDLASVAGIIAAIGTGVNDQIVITDELLKGGIDATSGGSLANRAKRAFFIVVAAASTALATLMPIIVLGTGLGKLVGFAITTAVGVLGGVFITRPAFGEFAKYLLQKK